MTVSTFAVYSFLFDGSQVSTIDSDPYVGVAFCGNTTAEAKMVIDKTKTYTNLFVLDTGRSILSRNEPAVYEICDYATANGLSIIINLGIDSVTEDDVTTWFWDANITEIRANWTERWGDKFLGMYYNDELGGTQLDGSWNKFFTDRGDRLASINYLPIQVLDKIQDKLKAYIENGTKPENYDLEAYFYDMVFKWDPGLQKLNGVNITSFTADYGLYWWNYLGGYDVMLAELGWNASVAQQIAQVKGAARLQDKNWGTMITWKYTDVPFLDSAKSIYDQMIASYQAGAKYIMIFDYAKDENATNTAAAMTDEHYMALYQYWQDTHSKQYEDNSKAEAALVLPYNYGWGMRNPNDTIWGFWPTDDKTEQIAINMYQLLELYGTRLDIVYDDAAYPVAKVGYQRVYYWNQTIT
jgi:hypothetical protein